MGRKIIINEEQYRGLLESRRRTIIINESQLDVLCEYENGKVLRYDFEAKVRRYMEELKDNPCKPKYDGFFVGHGIPEDVLQDKMLDLGMIKRVDKIDEPADANGDKHSVHTRKYIFSSKNFDDNIGKLYGHFFKDGESVLKECDCGDASAGGATNVEGVGGQYTVPFGGVQRRKIGVSGDTESSIDKVSNIDMKPTADRKRGKIAVNRVK